MGNKYSVKTLKNYVEPFGMDRFQSNSDLTRTVLDILRDAMGSYNNGRFSQIANKLIKVSTSIEEHKWVLVSEFEKTSIDIRKLIREIYDAILVRNQPSYELKNAYEMVVEQSMRWNPQAPRTTLTLACWVGIFAQEANRYTYLFRNSSHRVSPKFEGKTIGYGPIYDEAVNFLIHNIYNQPDEKEQTVKQEDPTNPTYYRDFDGVENIQVAERLNFLLGNAEKYIVRAGDKNPDTLVEDLQKAVWYLERQRSTMINESAYLEFDLSGVEWKKIAWKLPHTRSQAMFHLLNDDICRLDDIDLAINYIRLEIEANTPGRAELIK